MPDRRTRKWYFWFLKDRLPLIVGKSAGSILSDCFTLDNKVLSTGLILLLLLVFFQGCLIRKVKVSSKHRQIFAE